MPWNVKSLIISYITKIITSQRAVINVIPECMFMEVWQTHAIIITISYHQCLITISNLNRKTELHYYDKSTNTTCINVTIQVHHFNGTNFDQLNISHKTHIQYIYSLLNLLLVWHWHSSPYLLEQPVNLQCSHWSEWSCSQNWPLRLQGSVGMRLPH